MGDPRGFAARYDGWCTDCDQQFRVGDIIMPGMDGGYVHRACPEAITERARAEICEQCFLEKPCPCEDDQ